MKMKFWTLAFLICALLLACSSHRRGAEPPNTLPRAQPAFMQWLTRQSLHAQAGEKISGVSQSPRLWMNSGSGHKPSILLTAAPSWLELNALANVPRRPLFKILAPETDEIAGFGFSGVFLGPTGERPGIWLGDEKDKARQARTDRDSFGHDFASLSFDPALGSEDDFDNLARRAETAHIQLGSDLVGAATGIGPDFMLAARRASGFSGIYAMMSVPEALWTELPTASAEWEFMPLDASTVAKLAQEGVLPGSVARDALEWASPGGWAVTGPVLGVDGQHRRWVYRYSGSPLQPVLFWQDPSSGAKRIFSASIITNTGYNRQSLVGIRIEPFIGLEAASETLDMDTQMAPALQALDVMAREIHRYGGWAIQASPLPAQAISSVIAGGCDFCSDAVTSALVAAAARTGDVSPLARLYGEWLESGLDISRLGRGLNDGEGVHWKLLRNLPDGEAIIREAGFADMSGSQPPAMPEGREALDARSFCELSLAWRLGLPGLGFIGAAEMEFMGKNFGGSAYTTHSAGGEGASFAAGISSVLKARQKYDLANGRLALVSRAQGGAMTILSELPSGGYWLMGTNFGGSREVVEMELPKACKASTDVLTGAELGPSNLRKFRLALDGRRVRHVVLFVN